MSTKDKLRVVYDCNVLLVAAAKEKSTAAACLWLDRSGYVRLFLTTNEDKSVRIYPRTAFLPVSELLEMANKLWPEGLTKEKRERYLPSAKPQATTASKQK